MFFAKVISFGLMVTSAWASEAFTPVHPFGAMLPRDTWNKRQGYYPTTSYCGTGDTCKEACGSTYEQCASLSGLYCYVPSIGEQCCPDLTGNSCDEGYYCTTDGAGTTYCCPKDLDLSNCAAAYSLTVSLIRETATPTPSAPSSSLIHVTVPTPSISIPSISIPDLPSISVPDIPSISLPPIPSISLPSYPTGTLSPPAPTGNASFTTPLPPKFTGGAGKVAGAGMAVFAGVAVARLL